MNPRTLGSSILLTVVVAVTVLLIGAFAHFDNSRGEGSDSQTNLPAPVAATAITPTPPLSPSTLAAVPATLPADLSPGLADVIKLAQSHVAEETIIAFIQNSGKTYNPTAEEVLYLTDLGLSDKVINSLFNKPAAVAAATNSSATATAGAAPPEDMVQPSPPAAMVDPAPLDNPQDSYFYDDLAPYGSWVQVVDIGWCWQPMVSSVDTQWVPYRDRGHWVLTDEGWYWASDFSWGWATFHYGRWSHDSQYGWVWSPGSVWAPAWVAWRDSDTYSGWAPLPPGVLFQPGIGLFAGEGMPGLDASFGLSVSAFTFVTYDHFLSPRVGGFAAKSTEAPGLFQGSKPVNNYSIKGRKVIHAGVSPDRIAAATKMPVRTYVLQQAMSPETSGGRVRGPVPGLAVFRPEVSAPVRRSSANAPVQQVLINKTSSETTDNSGQMANRSSEGLPARPGFSGFTSDNFQPSSKRISPSADVSAPMDGRSPSLGNFEATRVPRPFESAGAPRYSASAPPAFAPRSDNPGPSAAPASPQTERREPAYNPPPQAQYESRGSGQAYQAQTQGGGSQSSSTTSGASKNPYSK